MWILCISERRLQKLNPIYHKTFAVVSSHGRILWRCFVETRRSDFHTFFKSLSLVPPFISNDQRDKCDYLWTFVTRAVRLEHTLPSCFISSVIWIMNYRLDYQWVCEWFLVMDDVKWALNHLSVMTVCCRFCGVRAQKQTHWARDEAEPNFLQMKLLSGDGIHKVSDDNRMFYGNKVNIFMLVEQDLTTLFLKTEGRPLSFSLGRSQENKPS